MRTACANIAANPVLVPLPDVAGLHGTGLSQVHQGCGLLRCLLASLV